MQKAIIDLPDGRRAQIEFDSREQLDQAIAELEGSEQLDQTLAEPASGGRSLGQELLRQGGLAGRAVATGLAALPLTALEGGAGIGNLINRAMGREGNYSPTADFEAGLDAVFPRPETTLEKGVQIGGAMVAGARTPGMPAQAPTSRAPTQADLAIAEGAKRQVPVFYDDVGGPVAKKVGTAAESLGPLGTGSGRAVQGQAAKAAAAELVDDYATNATDDVPLLIQRGLQRRLRGFQTGARRLYERADHALAANGQVDATQIRQIIAARIAKERQLGSAADEGTIAVLEKYLNAPDGDFAHWRQLRSALGSDISDYYTGKGAIGSKGVDALQEVKTTLDAQLAAHAKKSGGTGYDAWRRADAFYRQNVVPFKEAGFKDLVKTAEPEKSWRYLLTNNTDSRAARLFNGLDRQGRQAVKYGLLKEAQDAATDAKGNFSPARFAKYLEDHDKAVGAFFKGAEKQDIDGFRNLMRHIERAGQYAENPPTGNRLIPFLLGGAAVVEPNSAAAVAATGLTIRGGFQTQAGRSFLMAAAKLKPGSPEMQRLLETITRYAAAASVAAQASADGR